MIHPLSTAARPARLGPCLLQKHPGLGDVTDGPPMRGSWKWRWPQLSQAPCSSSSRAAGASCSANRRTSRGWSNCSPASTDTRKETARDRSRHVSAQGQSGRGTLRHAQGIQRTHHRRRRASGRAPVGMIPRLPVKTSCSQETQTWTAAPPRPSSR